MHTLHILGWCGLGLLVVVPPLVLRIRFGAGWPWFFLGIASWMLGVSVKFTLGLLEDAMGAGSWPIPVRGTVDGLISALTELLAAALFLRRPGLKLADVLAFGVGIGAFEVLFILGMIPLERLDAAVQGLPTPPILPWPILVERAITVVGHTASRVLLYAGLHLRSAPVLAACIALFALVDGTAVYGTLAGWDFGAPAVLAGFWVFLAAVGAIEVVLAAHFWRRLERSAKAGAATG